MDFASYRYYKTKKIKRGIAKKLYLFKEEILVIVTIFSY